MAGMRRAYRGRPGTPLRPWAGGLSRRRHTLGIRNRTERRIYGRTGAAAALDRHAAGRADPYPATRSAGADPGARAGPAHPGRQSVVDGPMDAVAATAT